MATDTAIGWTDHTFNPWIGCAHVHAGCTNCYAEQFAKRTGKAKWGVNGTRIVTSQANWRTPLKWNREAQAAGRRARVFCASLADVFEDWPGVVMTGGAAQMAGMVELAADAFGTGVRRGIPGEQTPGLVTGLSDSVESPRFATVVGLALYASGRLATGAIGPDYTRLRARGLRRMKDKLANWFSEFF